MEDAEGQKLLEEMCPSLVEDSQGKVVFSEAVFILWIPKQISHALPVPAVLNLVTVFLSGKSDFCDEELLSIIILESI